MKYPDGGWLQALWIPILASALTAPAFAGSLAVKVHDRDRRPVDRELVVLHVLAGSGLRVGGRPGWSPSHSAITDVDGRARFSSLGEGAYAVLLPRLGDRGLLSPSDNPVGPPPRATIFDRDDALEIEIEVRRGVRASVYLDVPYDRVEGFAAVFRHRETGRALRSPYRRDVDFVDRLLLPGVWDVSVEPTPGYLLVGVEHERQPVPGSTVRLDLAQDPRAAFLRFAYAAPATLTGQVTAETGKPVGIQVEASLLRPGSWIDAARRRGGSTYDRVTAAVDPDTGLYEAVLPDGLWTVRPVGSTLEASQPEAVEVELAAGGTGRADFTVRLDEGTDEESLTVAVRGPGYAYVAGAPVEVYGPGGDSPPLRRGTTNRYGRTVLPGVEKGDYTVVAGHPDYLAGSVDLRDLGALREPPRALVSLSRGAEVRVRAADARDRPLGEVEVTLARLDDLPEILLQDPAFLAAKGLRSATTDASGRSSLAGFYAGRYRATARLLGRDRTRGMIYLSRRGENLEPEIEIEIESYEKVELEARLLPAASWTATLVCADPRWALPDAADLKVFDLRADVAGRDLEDAEAEGGPALALEAAVLGGRHHDLLSIGPLAVGTYRLAVRPSGFDRWTWAFEATDPLDADELQAVPDVGDGPTHLGDFQVECGPAVDLLPAVLDGAPFPDLQDVDVAARVLDRDGEEEIGRPPIVYRRRGRFELRRLPRGPMRLEFVFTHPHFLAVPTQSWQVALELERGQFREVVAQIEAIGGAVRIEGPGASARLYGPGDVYREAAFADGAAEIPSLVPGPYRLEVVDGSGTVVRVWPELEVQAGVTVRLEPEF